MLSSRDGLTRRSGGGRRSALAGLAALAMIASTGCQVEYAGMTLPSGKYMQDDVQYFAPGPEFPYANSQAATQRARMQAAGQPLPPAPGFGGPGAGAMPGGPGAGGAGIPRLNAAPEAENSMPGGASSPNPAVPGPTPPANTPPGNAPPAGAMPAPPG